MPKIHPVCGSLVTYAEIPGKPGQRVILEAYPDAAGDVRVDCLPGRFILLPRGAASSARTKRYARHQCVTSGVLSPEVRGRQLTIGDA